MARVERRETALKQKQKSVKAKMMRLERKIKHCKKYCSKGGEAQEERRRFIFCPGHTQCI